MGSLTVLDEHKTSEAFSDIQHGELFRINCNILVRLKSVVFSSNNPSNALCYNAFNFPTLEHVTISAGTLVQRCSAVLDWCLDDKTK